MSGLISWKGSVAALVVVVLLSGCGAVDRIKADSIERDAEKSYAARDYPAAADAYRRSADLGSGYGQYMLSWMYANGRGVKKDRAEAMRWMQKAADSGYPAANFTLGVRTLRGEGGLKKDPKGAVGYFQKAADAEDDISMFYLGMMHMRGIGVTADAKEALRWFRMAKAHGYPVNQRLLSEEGVTDYMQKSMRGKAVTGGQKTDDRKAVVRDVQVELKRLGYKVGTPDGAFGARTKSAIEAFQRSRGLTVDGRATPEVLEALKAAK